jgi:hypothetical protein
MPEHTSVNRGICVTERPGAWLWSKMITAHMREEKENETKQEEKRKNRP